MEKDLQEIPLRRKLGISMVETYNSVYEQSQEFFAKYGLTSQQYNVLSILYDAGTPLSTSAILKRMLEKNAGVSRLVDRLIAKDLVEKKVNPEDKRLIDVQLTGKGEVLYYEVFTALPDVDAVYKNLTDTEVELLMTLLSKIRES
ncbi:MarR family winged helix-turn-helix transcriptional regulator [Chryseobacterium rhizosphaerae]|uniref:MarR family winged helix-turn-helix transcriptional regulator n=1 Tax=Chryseobacterium rhizosphaerae TaxID=395937 RepID=UPI0023593F33|nr:MarR family transcriptional regulator [Chryseobacterium rhizosphaerae]MDC8099350.1 MarR family transcriptional regulator [Chryseobacterium rhizosphaerae]